MTFGFRNTYKKPDEVASVDTRIDQGPEDPSKPLYKINPDNPFGDIMLPKAPVYDEKRQTRDINRAKFSVLGQALTHLGDVTTQSMGGNAIKRAPGDQEKYLDDYQKYQDEFAKKTEDYDAANWMRNLQLTKAGIDKDNADNSFKANRKDADDRNYQWGQSQESSDAYRKEMTGQGRERLNMAKKEQDERLGSEEVTYMGAQGKNITTKIPIPEQKDLISRAKNDPYFANYIKEYMKASPVQVRVPDGYGGVVLETQFVNETGRNITDQDLLQSFLRYKTEGTPNKNYAIQHEERTPQNAPVDYGQGEIVPNYSQPVYNQQQQQPQQTSTVPPFFQ